MNLERRSFIKEWIPAIELMIVLITILGSTIPLYLHTDSKMSNQLAAIREENREDKKQTEAILRGILEEMKDFHGKLCSIEERNKQKKD